MERIILLDAERKMRAADSIVDEVNKNTSKPNLDEWKVWLVPFHGTIYKTLWGKGQGEQEEVEGVVGGKLPRPFLVTWWMEDEARLGHQKGKIVSIKDMVLGWLKQCH